MMGGTALAESPQASAGSGAGFLSGPSLFETGRVGGMELPDRGPKIQPMVDPIAMPGEPSVRRAAEQIQAAPAPVAPSGRIDAKVLESEVESRLVALGGCRVEVARRNQIALGAVVAGGPLTLRWTVLPTGLTAQTEVVASDPVDLRLIDCIKREMSLWTFTGPRGGSLRVIRTFAFR